METDRLQEIARATRRQVLEMCAATGGHIVSSFSCVEILVALYYGGGMRQRPGDDAWEKLDRFILSKGHAETVLYAVLADRGYFPKSWLTTSYRQGDCRLGGHPDRKIPGVEATSGSLGHGLGVAAGMALAARLDGREQRIFTLMGDAECTEGSVWEAAMFAGHQGLTNLVGIVDRNGMGCLDRTGNYTGLEPLAAKWQAFGWEVRAVDGHSFPALLDALAPTGGDRPVLVLAETVKGRGVSFMEDDPTWHVKGIGGELIERARRELEVGR